jgi:uncharacterized membrane protein YfcA
MYSIEIIGIAVLSILMMLCTLAGIGGGGVVVPLLSVFYSFTFKEATAISGFSILICSIARFIYNISQMHPEKKAVSIDYGLAIVMLPTVMMGSFIGVIMNAMLPELVLQICLTLLLGFLTVQSALKAREIFKKENAKIKEKKKAAKQAAAALGKERNMRILGDQSDMEVERRSIKMRRDDVSESDNETSVRESIIVDEKFKILN